MRLDNLTELALRGVLKNPILSVLSGIANIHDKLKANKELQQIITVIRTYTKKELEFMFEN